MDTPNRLVRAFAACAAACMLLPAARAQTLTEADTREIRTYTLTDAALGRYIEATRSLSAIPLDCGGSESGAEEAGVGSLAEAAARIDAVPGARAAVQAAGMTSREYVVFAFSLIENAFAAYALEQPGGTLPSGVSMANIEFLRRNAGAIEQLANDTEVARCAEDDGGR